MMFFFWKSTWSGQDTRKEWGSEEGEYYAARAVRFLGEHRTGEDGRVALVRGQVHRSLKLEPRIAQGDFGDRGHVRDSHEVGEGEG
jgi:hypothetical protein